MCNIIVGLHASMIMSTRQTTADMGTKKRFWDNVTRYTSASSDKQFVDELAYVMVTLHRTGN